MLKLLPRLHDIAPWRKHWLCEGMAGSLLYCINPFTIKISCKTSLKSIFQWPMVLREGSFGKHPKSFRHAVYARRWQAHWKNPAKRVLWKLSVVTTEIKETKGNEWWRPLFAVVLCRICSEWWISFTKLKHISLGGQFKASMLLSNLMLYSLHPS